MGVLGYINYEMWTRAYQDCKILTTQDSDKILPSSARCIGFLAGGLKYTTEHRVILHEIIELLVSTRFGCDLSLENGKEVFIEDQITKISQKLSSAICQALGFVGKALAKHHHMSFRCLEDCQSSVDVYNDNLSKIELIKIVLSVMLKRCKPKIQLQACKGLINLYVLEASHAAKTSSMMSSSSGESLFAALDSSLIATSTIANSESTEENTIITRSLRRATLLLINLILEFFCDKLFNNENYIDKDVDLKQKLLVVLLHHIDGLVEWLEKYIGEKNEIVKVSSFMLALPCSQRDNVMIYDDDDYDELGAMYVEDDESNDIESEPTLMDSYADEIDKGKDKSSTHEMVVKISKMLYDVITRAAGPISDGSVDNDHSERLEAMLPRQAMSKLIWLVAADTSTFLSFAPLTMSHAVASPPNSGDMQVTKQGIETNNGDDKDDADLDIDNIINIRDFDDNDEI